MNIKDITITSLETITAFDVVTGNYKFTLDELQNATIANTQDSTEITGKGGRKLANLKRNKAVTISGTNGLVSGGLLEAQTGGKFETKATDVMWTDYLTVAGGNRHSGSDFVQMVVDWECARYTKPDKPLNARDTLDKFYPELKDEVLPVIQELGL